MFLSDIVLVSQHQMDTSVHVKFIKYTKNDQNESKQGFSGIESEFFRFSLNQGQGSEFKEKKSAKSIPGIKLLPEGHLLKN